VKRALFVAEAREELLFEIRYYNSERPGLGARFAQAIEEAVARALSFPMTGSRATKNTKRIFVHDFPFAVVYRTDSEGIVVFAIAHHRRRPDYWRSRVQDK
jgi:toxin ParE1/3/4